jgi:hypothetical protein
MKIKHKKSVSHSVVAKKRKKKTVEILSIDDKGQIVIDNRMLLKELQAVDEAKREKARQKFLKQLESAHLTINKNKLHVVVEEYTEEDDISDYTASGINASEKYEKSTVYSNDTHSAKSSLDHFNAQQFLDAALSKSEQDEKTNKKIIMKLQEIYTKLAK